MAPAFRRANPHAGLPYGTLLALQPEMGAELGKVTDTSAVRARQQDAGRPMGPPGRRSPSARSPIEACVSAPPVRLSGPRRVMRKCEKVCRQLFGCPECRIGGEDPVHLVAAACQAGHACDHRDLVPTRSVCGRCPPPQSRGPSGPVGGAGRLLTSGWPLDRCRALRRARDQREGSSARSDGAVGMPSQMSSGSATTSSNPRDSATSKAVRAARLAGMGSGALNLTTAPGTTWEGAKTSPTCAPFSSTQTRSVTAVSTSVTTIRKPTNEPPPLQGRCEPQQFHFLATEGCEMLKPTAALPRVANAVQMQALGKNVETAIAHYGAEPWRNRARRRELSERRMPDQDNPPARGPGAKLGEYISAEQCRQARALLGLTPQALSAMAGVSAESIQRFEEADHTVSGRVRAAVGCVLARLGIDVEGEHRVMLNMSSREAPDAAVVDANFYARFSRVACVPPGVERGGSKGSRR